MLLEGHLTRLLKLLHGSYPLYFLFSTQFAGLLHGATSCGRILVHVRQSVERLHFLLELREATSHQIFELGGGLALFERFGALLHVGSERFELLGGSFVVLCVLVTSG